MAAQVYLCKVVVHAGILHDSDVLQNPGASKTAVPRPQIEPRALDLSLAIFFTPQVY